MKLNCFIKRGIIFAILIVSFVSAFAFEVLYKRIDQDKLTHLYVSDIVKDEMGYMWFGTSMGLNRWDGYSYKYFLSNASNPYSISSNKINKLLKSNDGKIWVATTNGLNLFDPSTEIFQHFLYKEDEPGTIGSNNIICFDNDKYGRLWVGTDKGLFFLDSNREYFTKLDFKSKHNLEGNFDVIRSIFSDSYGYIWVGFNLSGLLKINTETLETTFIETYNENNEVKYISSVNNIIEHENGNLLLATWGSRIIEIDKNSNYRIKSWPGNKHIFSATVENLAKDTQGHLWVADQYNSIIRFNTKNEIVEKVSTNSSPQSIPSTHLSRIKSIEGSIWAGTFNHGFFKINYIEKPVKNIYPHGISADDFQITALDYISPNTLVVSTIGENIFFYDENEEDFLQVEHSFNYAKSVYYDKHDKKTWIGSFSNSVKSLSENDSHFKDEFNLESNQTAFVIEGNDSLIFVALWAQGIRIFNKKTKNIHYPGINSIEKSFSSLDLFLDNEYLWIASNNSGLIRYNIIEDKFDQFKIKNTKSILANNQMNIVERLSNNKLLVSTIELGICYFNEEDEAFIPVGVETGINQVHVKSMIEDPEQNIWLITERKAIKTNHNFDYQISYTMHDGINYGIEHRAATFSPNTGRIYIGGNKGLQYFASDKLNSDTAKTNVVITDIKIFNNSLTTIDKFNEEKSVSYINKIELSPKQNFISIDFSAMIYNSNSSRIYAYRLIGANSNWNQVPYNQNSITYSNLKPGEYTFEVMVSNEQGIWLSEPTKVEIVILPPFWQTNLFRFIVFIAIVSIIISFIRYREYRLINEKRKLEKLVKQRTSQLQKHTEEIAIQRNELEKANNVKNKFFSIISHDLRNPMGSVVQLTDLLTEKYDTLEKENLKEIMVSTSNSAKLTMELLEDLLEWAGTQTNRIKYNKQAINLHTLANTVIASQMLPANRKSISINNNLFDNIDVVADENTIKTVFRNLISNAIKFSPKGSKITLGNLIEQSYLKVSIKDKGVGIPPEKIDKIFSFEEKTNTYGTDGESGSGLGLSLCKEFVEKNGGKIWAESARGKGSVFYFTLPLNI